MSEVEEVLKHYTLEEILELNELSEEDLLEYLVDRGMVVLPVV